MSERPQLERLCVHETVDEKIPIEAFADAFSDLDVPVEIVGDDEEFDQTDAVASFRPREAFLDAGWTHCIRAGYDEFDTDAHEAAGVPLTNSTGIHDTTVGELAVGYMVSLARMLHIYRDHQNANDWLADPEYERPFTVENERLCVVGLGPLGQGIAKRADALGMDVVGVDIRPVSGLGLDRVYDAARIQQAVEDARFVVLTTPLTEATRGLVDRDVFDAMRDDAYLINVSRGAIVDQDALVEALENDDIAGAALDVFYDEPLPADAPFWEMEEVIVTPHAAAQAATYGDRIADLLETNLSRLGDGGTLWNRIV